MRLGRITPQVEIVITEGAQSRADGDAHRIFLFRGQPGLKARAGRRLLRVAGRFSWGVVAAPVLWMCRAELAETMLACDLDGLDVSGVSWGPWLRRALERRFPRVVLGGADGSHLNFAVERVRDTAARVSIVLPVHNVGRFLHQSVESCLTQTYQNIELIIVDDGSAVDVASALTRYGDGRMHLLRHSVNSGIAAALNTGFAAATGEFLTWTSDDNYYDPHAIEKMVAFLQTYRAVDFVYADMFIVDERDSGQPAQTREAKPPAWFRAQESNPVGACFLYRRHVHDTLGGYDTKAFLVEDYEYWLRVARRFRMQRLFSPLYYYRYHDETLTAKHDRSLVLARLRQVRRQHRAWSW